MKALLYKEYESIKYIILITCLLLAGLVYSLLINNKLFVLPLMFAYVPVVLTQHSFFQDDKNNIETFYIASPIGRRKVVMSRYVLTWGFALLTTLLMLIGQMMHYQSNEVLYLMMSISFVVPLLINSINIPINIKFGIQKGRYFMVVIMMLAFLIPFIAGTLGLSDNIVALFETLSSLSYYLIGTGVLLAGVILTIISVCLSLLFYKKKQF